SLTVTPALDTALVLRTAAIEGSRRAMSAGFGICLGCLAWGFAAGIGLAAVLAASSLLYGALRAVRAVYLAYLGIRILMSAGKRRFEATPMNPAYGVSPIRWVGRGLLTNLLNPKVGVFYVTFLPQFVPEGVRIAPFSIFLAGIRAAEGWLWFAFLTLATERLTRWLRRPSFSATLDRTTGLLFIGVGIVLM